MKNDENPVLKMGLKFCPTPNKSDPGQYKESLYRFFRLPNLHLIFNDSSSTDTEPPNDEDLDLSLLEEDTHKPF